MVGIDTGNRIDGRYSMNKNKTQKSETTIQEVAEVHLGEYVARFTEEDLKKLYDLVDFVNDMMHDCIKEYYDYFLEAYVEDNSRAEEYIKRMDGLRGFAWWFDQVKDIDIRHEAK